MNSEVALVTGAGRGIGSRIALALADSGCDIVVATRSTREAPGQPPGTIDEVADQVRARGRHAITLPLDVHDETAVAAAVEAIYDKLGGCDLLVNNAGVITLDPVVSTPVVLAARDGCQRDRTLPPDAGARAPHGGARPRAGHQHLVGRGRRARDPAISYRASKRALPALSKEWGQTFGSPRSRRSWPADDSDGDRSRERSRVLSNSHNSLREHCS